MLVDGSPLYIVVATKMNPDGEIRGQIKIRR